ncbi:MAG: hypothetical protein JST54_19910 [Deltaproteobacteria bacterium]|nr:hypothetical protein [Deltaproteobacteria bacterium]
MGLFDWFRRKPKQPTDPLAAYDARIDALAQRAQLLRRSAATLLAVRRDLDRRGAELEAREETALKRSRDARAGGDEAAADVLAEDAKRSARDREPLQEQREKVARDAADLAEAVKAVEAESEELQRERDGAKVALAAGHAVLSARPALTDHFDESLKLEAARDEVEKAHALAEIYREDALRKRQKA